VNVIAQRVVRMKAERLRRGWTQIDLAYHSRVHPAEISRFETGIARPYPGQARRLAAALCLEPSQLLEDEGPDVVSLK
jgi:transcriptional regulator with XRE-family HTH domain